MPMFDPYKRGAMLLRISQQKVLENNGHSRGNYEKGLQGQAEEEADNPRNSWLADTGSPGNEPGQGPAEVHEAAVDSEAVQGKYSRYFVNIGTNIFPLIGVDIGEVRGEDADQEVKTRIDHARSVRARRTTRLLNNLCGVGRKRKRSPLADPTKIASSSPPISSRKADKFDKVEWNSCYGVNQRDEHEEVSRAELGEVETLLNTPNKKKEMSPALPKTPVMLRKEWKVYGSPDIIDKPAKKILIPDCERQSVPLDLTSPAKPVLAPESLPEQGVQQVVDNWLEKNDFNNNLAARLSYPEGIVSAVNEDQACVGSELRCQDGQEQIFQFFPGNVVNVEFLDVAGTTQWDEKRLKTYYFLAEGSTPQCLRAGPGSGIVSMKQIMDSVYHRLRLDMQKPFLSFKGKVVDLETPLSLFNGNSAFIIHDTQIPEKFMQHGGKLWQCSLCLKEYSRKAKFKNLACLNSKKDDRHKFFFYHNSEAKIPDSWGNQAGDRKGDKPWACPIGHTGPKQAAHEEIQSVARAYEGTAEAEAFEGRICFF